MRRQHGAAGMTLIEVLVAMCLLAILSVLGYKAFSALLVSRERLMETSTRWVDLARTFARFGDETAAADGVELDDSSATLRLLLRGRSTATGTETIVYRADGSGLRWASDRAGNAAFAVLGNEYRVRCYLLLDDGREIARWRRGDPGQPVAVGMRVSGPLVGQVHRLWRLP